MYKFTNHHLNRRIYLIFIFIAFSYIYLSLFLTSLNVDARTGDNVSATKHCTILSDILEKSQCADDLFSEIKHCTTLSDVTGKEECYLSLCRTESGSNECVDTILIAAVSFDGPEYAISILKEILSGSLFKITEEGRYFSWIIGQVMVQSIGPTGKAFLRCPSDFHNSCQFGFFDTLGYLMIAKKQFEIPVEVLDQKPGVQVAVFVCDRLEDAERNTCYHGMGRVFMDRKEIDLDEALSLCDGLPHDSVRVYCFGGVFMENVNKALLSDRVGDGFIKDDLLAPCSRVGKQYQEKCYENHGRYLLDRYNSVQAGKICTETEEYANVCLQSLENVNEYDRNYEVYKDDEPGDQVSIWGQFLKFLGIIKEYLSF